MVFDGKKERERSREGARVPSHPTDYNKECPFACKGAEPYPSASGRYDRKMNLKEWKKEQWTWAFPVLLGLVGGGRKIAGSKILRTFGKYFTNIPHDMGRSSPFASM